MRSLKSAAPVQVENENVAVSLWDLMRPVALFGGVGAASAIVTHHGGGLARYLITIGVALAGGILAVGVSQIMVKRLDPWIASHHSGRTVELLWMALYLAVFIGIVLASFGAGIGAFSVMNDF